MEHTPHLAQLTDHTSPLKRCRVHCDYITLVSISEQSDIAETITGKAEVKSVCASWGFFMSGYVEFYNEGRVHWQLLLRKVSWIAIFLSFLASWLFEISIYHRKNPPQKQESPGTRGQDCFSATVL